MRRALWVTLGCVAAALIARQVAHAWTPADGAGSLGERFGDFLAEVREVAAEREVELREALGLDGRHDLVDSYPRRPGDAHSPDNPATGPRAVEDNG
jgi:hypothetical protein